jgi:Domain of unknown function (DUF1942)
MHSPLRLPSPQWVWGHVGCTDRIPQPVAGTLWEATATDDAIEGSATPIVSNLNARARSGETCRVLFGVATPQGVNPATLPQGQETTGKVYFDVVGDSPDSVVYNAGDQDVLPPRRRRRYSASADQSRGRSFNASRRGSVGCCAIQTLPIPPEPSRPRI